MFFEQGHIRITVSIESDILHQHSSPSGSCPLPFMHSQLFAVDGEICCLCRAAVSPGDVYPAAQGTGEPVHSITHRSP